MNILTEKAKHEFCFFSFVLALMPILNIYQFIIKGIGVGDVLAVIALCRLIIRNRTIKISIIHSNLLLFWGYGVLISFITLAIHSEFSFRDVIVRLVIFVFYTTLICIPSREDFNRNSFVDYYLKLAILCSLFVFLQTVSFYAFHRIILGIIPGVPLNYAIGSYSELLSRYSSMYAYFYRPTSLFPEPAHFAQFIGPALLLVLFDNSRKNHLGIAVIFSVAALLSTSTNAIIIVATAWGCYFIFENFRTKNIKNLFNIIAVVVSVILVVVVASKISGTFSYGLERMRHLIKGTDASGSAYERVMKGFEIWKQLRFGEQIFGIGYGTYGSYYSLGTISVYNGEVEYMSSLSYIMVCGGIVSLLLFISAILKYMHKKTALSISLGVFLLIIFTSSSVLNTPIYAIVLLLICHDNFSLYYGSGGR